MPPTDLVLAARVLMREHGLEPSFPEPVQREVRALTEALPLDPNEQVRDLRQWAWSSIDNPESRDLDQLEYAQLAHDGTIRLFIAIADVSSRVQRGSATDQHAGVNTVSVYTGVVVFPMLPERLSTDLTSLNPLEDRLALVTAFDVDPDGELANPNVFRALVRNQVKLDYPSVGAWLDGRAKPPEALAASTELTQQLTWQDDAAQRLEHVRRRAGALNIETLEARPVMANGRVIEIACVEPNRARELIENFMVSANVVMAGFLEAHGLPAIRRIVRTPKRWDRIVEIAAETGDTLPDQPDSRALSSFLERRRMADPANFPDLSLTIVKLLGPGEYVMERPNQDESGHFGLALAEYTHSTAPNRRYPDLVVQRLARAALENAPAPYLEWELESIATHCTEQENAARKVERTMRKKAAALLLSDRVGESFPAIVTGASVKGTYVRLLRPPVEGRVMRGAEGLDVGMTVRVRLLGVDVQQGYIDFETSAASRERKLERSKRKKAMAARLTGRIGETFDAVVTGVTERGAWVRTSDDVEGLIVRGSDGLKVGAAVRVRLVSADAVHGFIDFARH
ncbi:MAG: RNB domain-containing ribonuclease [Longimicrobiales bacterium]